MGRKRSVANGRYGHLKASNGRECLSRRDCLKALSMSFGEA
jgi:hypothetical protein